MKKYRNLLFNVVMIIFMVSVNLLLFNRLPQQMPTHWNIHGQIDSYMPKQTAVWLLPALALFFFGSV